MSHNLVSVVVPTYNRAYCLRRTLDSALAQSHRSLEILVVDDGSTDETGSMVRELCGSDQRVKYVRQENRGVSAARNRGMSLAQGDYIAFLDSDDVWKPWKLETQLACFRGRPEVVMVWTDMEAIDSEGRITCPRYLRKMYSAYEWFRHEDLFPHTYLLAQIAPELQDMTGAGGGTLSVGDIYSPMLMGNLVHTSTVVVRRQLPPRLRAGPQAADSRPFALSAIASASYRRQA